MTSKWQQFSMDGSASFCCSSLRSHSLSLGFGLWAVTVLLTVSICSFPANFWVRPPADKRSLGCFSADKVFNYSSYCTWVKSPNCSQTFTITSINLILIMYINCYIFNCPTVYYTVPGNRSLLCCICPALDLCCESCCQTWGSRQQDVQEDITL